jgi:MFS family permease
LIGIGVGGVYVPAVKAFSLWFKKKEFATMIGMLMSVGNLGAVIATTPLAWATATWGWRPTFFLIGGITLVLAFITLVFTRDHKPYSESAPVSRLAYSEVKLGTRSKVLQVVVSLQFWIIALIFFGIYGPLVTLQGLWATPFMMTALGVKHILASELNMLIPLGVIIGAPLFGWLSQRFAIDKRNTFIAILGGYTMAWVGIIFFFSPLGTVGLALTLLVMGIATGGFISTLWAIVRETTSSEILGLTSGMLNPAPFLGVAAFQVLTGAILDRADRLDELYPLSAFKSAFMVCLAATVICLGLSFFIRKTKGNS